MKKSKAIELLAQELCMSEQISDWIVEQDNEDDHDLHHQEEYCEALRMAIRELGREGWIPVTDRLPGDGWYLCTLDGELCGDSKPFTGMCGFEKGVWDEPDMVLAWMPLPEPYGGDTK